MGMATPYAATTSAFQPALQPNTAACALSTDPRRDTRDQ
jgi:hypothetical protein